jgi:hypothetical protein
LNGTAIARVQRVGGFDDLSFRVAQELAERPVRRREKQAEVARLGATL